MSEHNHRGFLVVTIDTEEEGLWSGKYTSQATVENIASVSRFQTVCDQFSIQPTYLVTSPVAESPTAVKVLRSIQEEGRCEIGAHIHPWNSPPIVAGNTYPHDSFLCNLPIDIQHAKLKQLTDRIEKNFGRRPLSFRAGRYGMSASGIKVLRDLGYRVDSSVLPRADYRAEKGPDFREATCWPYFPSNDDILIRGSDDSLLEIPVTAGFTHHRFELAGSLRRQAMRTPWRQLRAVGILDRTGIATKVKLSPEQATLKQMKQLARAVTRRGVPLLVLMFHSSSLLPGCSPYVRTKDDLEWFLKRLEAFFFFALGELELQAISLEECYDYRERIMNEGL